MKRIAGPLLATLILSGIGAILFMNLDLSPLATRQGYKGEVTANPIAPVKVADPVLKNAPRPKGDFREYPIGTEVTEVVKNAIRVSAVWLPAVGMDGNAMAGSDIIHLEADIKATEGNPQGFALGEFVPYLKIAYEIKGANGEAIHQGELLPMVASDGLHYGASVAMPKAGEYKLSYRIQPPSAGGLGRHSDPVTGVAPWWEPFTATFDWDYDGPPKVGK